MTAAPFLQTPRLISPSFQNAVSFSIQPTASAHVNIVESLCTFIIVIQGSATGQRSASSGRIRVSEVH